MPTYTFACGLCGARHELTMGITQYARERPAPHHCGRAMVRVIERAPALMLGNDRLYQGLRAPDGTDISSRAKHRQYMKDHDLTTVDDFKGTWERAAREREQLLQGTDPARGDDIAAAIHKLGG